MHFRPQGRNLPGSSRFFPVLGLNFSAFPSRDGFSPSPRTEFSRFEPVFFPSLVQFRPCISDFRLRPEEFRLKPELDFVRESDSVPTPA